MASKPNAPIQRSLAGIQAAPDDDDVKGYTFAPRTPQDAHMKYDALPFSPACERNKGPILAHLQTAFANAASVLEIGSGTGQHAVHFSQHLTQLAWQPSDCREWLPGLRARIDLEGPANLRAPFELAVAEQPWRGGAFDAIFSANTLHIMSWADVEWLFRGVGHTLNLGGALAVYGPFKYAGSFTSASNAEFDADLRRRDPQSGVRDFETVNRLAAGVGLALEGDYRMPANNQLLIWRRSH